MSSGNRRHKHSIEFNRFSPFLASSLFNHMTETPLILAVDDSPTQVMGMQILLQKAGYEVVTAANGMEAMTLVGQTRPTLVVTDLQMPELDGLELVDALRTDYPGLPIILTTAKGSEDIAAEALRRGEPKSILAKRKNAA